MSALTSQVIRGLFLHRNVIAKLPRNLLCSKPEIHESIDSMVKNGKVVVFMKGDPEQPRCGFSNAVVQILQIHGVPYDSYNVLENDDLRDGIKKYSNWPTIPQVFINGEFVGGCDIMLQLHQTGDLVKEFEKVGLVSAIKDNYDEKKK